MTGAPYNRFIAVGLRVFIIRKKNKLMSYLFCFVYKVTTVYLLEQNSNFTKHIHLALLDERLSTNRNRSISVELFLSPNLMLIVMYFYSTVHGCPRPFFNIKFVSIKSILC
jgi:hypothetical protein